MLERFRAQASLLVRTLPAIAEEEAFALKGGTAINFFHRDMPRLSVDADLTYLPIQTREETLAGIDAALERIRRRIVRRGGTDALRIAAPGGDVRLVIRGDRASIKIETSPVIRGTVHPPQRRRVTPAVEEAFGFAEMQVVAFEDLFAGKLVAALDRQHPRDLYDVRLLYDNEGLTDALFRTFLVYVASSRRPPHELLDPNPGDISGGFRTEFEGMTVDALGIDALLAARERLFADVRRRLDDASRRFLLSLHDGTPDFEAIGLPQAANLPAVRWKLLNLDRLRARDEAKHAEQRAAIERLF